MQTHLQRLAFDAMDTVVCEAPVPEKEEKTKRQPNCVLRYHNAGEYAVLQIWGEVHEVLKAYGMSGEDQARLLESWKTKKGGGIFRGLAG